VGFAVAVGVGWIVIWIAIVAGVAVSAESVSFALHHAGDIPALAVYYAALTLQLPVILAVIFAGARRGLDHLRRLTGTALSGNIFSLIVIGLPLVMVVMVHDQSRRYELFEVLAQVNATLAIAVVLDARRVLALAGQGASRGVQMSLRLGFLSLFVMGTMFRSSAPCSPRRSLRRACPTTGRLSAAWPTRRLRTRRARGTRHEHGCASPRCAG